MSTKLGSLLEVSLAFNRERDPDRLLQLVVDKAVELVEAERGCIVIFQRPGNRAGFLSGETPVLTAQRNLDALEGKRISSTAIRYVLESGKPAAWLDLAEGSSALSQADSVCSAGLRRILCAPLQVHGGPLLGALYVDARTERGPDSTDDDLLIFEALAAHAAVSIENSLLHKRLLHDALTGVYSRGYFEIAISDALEAALAEGVPLTLVLADLNALKTINETLGYPVGDDALRTLAGLLSNLCPLTFRLGGDEFAALEKGMGREAAQELRRRLIEMSEAVGRKTEAWHGIGVGLGVAPEDGTTPRQLYQAAHNDLIAFRGRPSRHVPYRFGQEELGWFRNRLTHSSR